MIFVEHKNVNDRDNLINFERKLESVYFDESCQNGCGESIKDFIALGFRGSVSVFVSSNDLINRGYKIFGLRGYIGFRGCH